MKWLVALAVLLWGCGEPFDFYAEQYAECVEVCEAGVAWLDSCGLEYGTTVGACTDEAWFVGWTPQFCEAKVVCIRKATELGNCPGEPGAGWDGWLPNPPASFCPVD